MSNARSSSKSRYLPFGYKVRNLYTASQRGLHFFEMINNNFVAGLGLPTETPFLLDLDANPITFFEYPNITRTLSEKVYPISQYKFGCFNPDSIAIFDVRHDQRNIIAHIPLPTASEWTDYYVGSNSNYLGSYDENILLVKNDKTIFSYTFDTNKWELCYYAGNKFQLTHMEIINNKFIVFQTDLNTNQTNIVLLNENFKKERVFNNLETKQSSLSPLQNKVMSPSGEYMALVYLDNTIKIYFTGEAYNPVLIQTLDFHNYPAWLGDNTLIYFKNTTLMQFFPQTNKSSMLQDLGAVSFQIAPIVAQDRVICIRDLMLYELPAPILANTKQQVADLLNKADVSDLPNVLTNIVVDYLDTEDFYTTAKTTRHPVWKPSKHLPVDISNLFQELYKKLSLETDNLQAQLDSNSQSDKKNILERLKTKFILLQALQVLANKIENNRDKTVKTIIQEVKKDYPQAFSEKTYSIFKEKNPFVYLIDKIEKSKALKKQHMIQNKPKS